MVLSTHRYFINHCSPAPIAETAAAFMLSLKTVQQIVCCSVVTMNIMSCRTEQKLKTSSQKVAVENIVLEEWVKDIIRVLIERNFLSKRFLPTIDDILKYVLIALSNADEFKYQSRSSFQRILKVISK
jgi:hypothetical protein